MNALGDRHDYLRVGRMLLHSSANRPAQKVESRNQSSRFIANSLHATPLHRSNLLSGAHGAKHIINTNYKFGGDASRTGSQRRQGSAAD
jgi:hypothetical protein